MCVGSGKVNWGASSSRQFTSSRSVNARTCREKGEPKTGIFGSVKTSFETDLFYYLIGGRNLYLLVLVWCYTKCFTAYASADNASNKVKVRRASYVMGGVLVVTPQKPRPNLCPWPRAYNFPSKITILIIIIIIIFVVIIIIIIIIISISFDVDVVHKKT